MQGKIGRLLILFFALGNGGMVKGDQYHNLLVDFQSTVAGCVERKDTKHAIFHGCYDWHSAVHGHWAIFRVARATGQNFPVTFAAEQSLSIEGIDEVERELTLNASFENPYGRSWFLRLAIDFEIWAKKNKISNPDRLRRLADIVSLSLRDHYQSVSPSPFSREYQNASWAFYQLHSYFKFSGQAQKLLSVRKDIETHFSNGVGTASFFADRKDFFSLFGNWIYLVAKTMTGGELKDFMGRHPIATGSLNPTEKTTSHSLGLVWSRAWSLSALARHATDSQQKERFKIAFENHLKRGVVFHQRYKDDYQSYGHWVPQFAIYALTESMEAGAEDDFLSHDLL